MMNPDGNGLASMIVLKQATRVREMVEKSDYSKCPVGNQKDVNLFMIDGITAIIEQQSKNNGLSWLSGTIGGGAGALISTLLYVTGKLHGWW